MKNKIELPVEVYNKMVEKIIDFYAEERGEEIGLIQGGIILDFFLNELGADIYNLCISDVQKYMSDKIDDMYDLMK